MTAADRLAALEQAHAAATPGNWESADGLRVVSPIGHGSVVADEVGSADAAAIVAEHNATPALIAALRAVLDLADELSTLAELNDARASEHHAAGRGADFEYRFGRSISYGQAATKIRTAIDAALGVDSGQQT